MKALCGFLGLTGHRRKFIKNYEIITKPLTDPLKKGASQWSPEPTDAFQRLKKAMTTSPTLKLPQFDEPFIMDVDARDKGIRAKIM